MNRAAAFPPAPERCWEDPEGTRRVWGLLAESERDDKYPGASSGGYRHLRFRLVSLRDVAYPEADHIRNPGSHHAYDDLVLNSQGDRNNPDQLYIYEVEYRRVFSVGLGDASRMHRTLETIYRRLRKFEEEHGTCVTYTQFVVRVAAILGVRWLVTEEPDHTVGLYRDGRYRFRSVRAGKAFLGQRLGWDVDGLVRDLWTEEDRAVAKQVAERRAAEEQARKQEQEDGSCVAS